MNTSWYNYPAAWTLEGSFCGSLGVGKEPFNGCCAESSKVLLPKIPLDSTSKQHPLQGFFTSIAAALPALSVGTSQPPERTDERNHSGASRGRGYSPRYAGRESKKETTCKFTGFAIRAVRGFRIIRSRIEAAMMEQEMNWLL